MADRFPSLEDFDSGGKLLNGHSQPRSKLTTACQRKPISRKFPTSPLLKTSSPEKRLSLAMMRTSSRQVMTQTLWPTLVEISWARATPRHRPLSPNFQTLPVQLLWVYVEHGFAGVDGNIMTGPSVNYNSGYQSYAVDEEEPEVIKQWREARDAQIAKRSEQFAAQREETIQEAQRNIDDFYDNYNAKKEKGIAQTRKEAEEFLANREDTVSGGTSWDRIAKLVDVSGKGAKGGAAGSGKERFREMLVSLRKDEKAPGATGY
ncbi:hypothetical protein THARTR1_07910 [Trichoderma harzianum]|uniref:Clathrin light chain n=1 Tax=Trichoderma harzianum TaxID=5544 RepID=A0A2K0U119_TRIHA|nr:hypothetical protein THARTR1_07910 [Trichoderma harzianum]